MVSTSHSGSDISGRETGRDAGAWAFMAHEISRIDRSIGAWHARSMLADVSFGTVWEAIAGALPDSVAISEPDRDYTFAEFEDRAARLAAALAAAGVGAGDKVACYLYNGAPYLETVFAAFKLGAVPVNANYRYTGGELTALLADADAAALVFSGDLAANAADAAQALPALRLLVRVGPAADPLSAAGSPSTLPAAIRDAPELASLYAVH